MTWPSLTATERVDRIKSVYIVGMSASKIGALLGTTRNSIIGYYSRNPDLAMSHPLPPATYLRTRQHAPRKQRERQNPKPKTVKPVPVQIEYREPPKSDGIPLLDLGRFSCRWAVNDAKQGELHLFCGAAGFPYCPHHAEMSRGHGTEGERSADRILKREMVK